MTSDYCPPDDVLELWLDDIDLARLSDNVTPADRSLALVAEIVVRRLADAVAVIQGKHPRRVGGTARELTADAAAWLYDLLSDPPESLSERLLMAAHEVAGEIAGNNRST